MLQVFGRGKGEGRVFSLMAAAVEREFTKSFFFFLLSLMCRPWGVRLKREPNEVCIDPELELELIQTKMTQAQRNITLVNIVGMQGEGGGCRFGFIHDH
jgi:hypothetical protein